MKLMNTKNEINAVDTNDVINVVYVESYFVMVTIYFLLSTDFLVSQISKVTESCCIILQLIKIKQNKKISKL